MGGLLYHRCEGVVLRLLRGFRLSHEVAWRGVECIVILHNYNYAALLSRPILSYNILTKTVPESLAIIKLAEAGQSSTTDV